jgi:hypothetical protein
MRIVEAPDGTCLVAARCSCGQVIDVADAVFVRCPSHEGPGCARCAGSGEIVDHRALAWRAATDTELQALQQD